MSVPPELQYMIISFVPQSKFIPVCKNWAGEIKSIQKKAVDKIGSWYKRRVVNIIYCTVPEMVRYFVIHYPKNLFITHPETSVKKFACVARRIC